MLKWLLHRMITAQVERPFGYDAGYLHALVDADPVAALKFSFVSGLTPRRAAPVEALAAAGIAGALTEDCGPCVQIGVDMALAQGARPAVVRAILAGQEEAMGEDAGLGYRFARAALSRDLEAADRWRDEARRRWGPRGVAALSLALTTARLYPTLKYAMGYGRACSRMMVAGEPAPFERPLPVAA